jgi:hypothetical protein
MLEQHKNFCLHRQTCGGDCMLCGEKGVHAATNLQLELKRILQRGLLSEPESQWDNLKT